METNVRIIATKMKLKNGLLLTSIVFVFTSVFVVAKKWWCIYSELYNSEIRL